MKWLCYGCLIFGLVGTAFFGEAAVPNTKDKVTITKFRGNTIYTSDGKKYRLDNRNPKKSYIPRDRLREHKLEGKEFTIKHLKRGCSIYRK